ncbi:ATP-binding protein [Devosia algicola]|uniref:histidine kinase n=1 Tax=Devosia algicola TaxID=3026418 RepID=A0ABY7YNG8_9HYPH|nr:PAS domain-containing sensor histidine kinase [Devosia algicola]WDR02779.1 ATP-binding protein [Devosia algicola]
MRSSDISDVGAEGFGTDDQATIACQTAPNVGLLRLSVCRNPSFNAVAITALTSAGLFIIYDMARTSAEVGSIDGVWQRAAIVGLMALVLICITLLRYGPRPDASQRASFQTLVGAMPLGVACWTESGRMIVCNEQYRNRLNLTSSGLRDAATYHEAVKHLIQGGYMKLLNDDDNNRLLELHRHDGSCLLIDERPLETGGFMTLVSDVTERKKTDLLLDSIRQEQRLLARRYHEEKLKAEAASRSKTNFLAHLSHDIRTPLNHIIGFAELMAHETYGALGDQRYRDYVETIKSSGEGLLASFATILDLAELESGQKVLRSEPMQVDALIESAVLRYRGQAARAGVEFLLGDGTQAIVCADKLALQRMLGNLIDNSLRFTPRGGSITVAAYAAADGVVIEVSDTGLGMSEERLESLQQPFALGDARFTREGVGPGLGISISRAIAELSGGHMAIDSSPATGTTVAISLPAMDGSTGVMQAAE